MKKKILFINGHMNPGGVEKSLLDILRTIDYSKYEVDLLLLEELGDYILEVPKEVNIHLVDLHNTYGSLVNSLIRCIRLRDWRCFKIRIVFFLMEYFGTDKSRQLSGLIVPEKEYDCAVGFRPGIASVLAAYAVSADFKVIWWHHGEINLSEKQVKEYLAVSQKADTIVSVSESCQVMLENKFPELKGKITVIPNMLDIADLRKKAQQYVPFKRENGQIFFVTVGRLSQEKHIENVIYAAEALTNKGIRNFHWYVVGHGEERMRLEILIREKKLESFITLTGNNPNPYPYMKHADVLIHTSYVESQCLVVLEAMALGIPCVVTESAGPKEFAINGENCILAEKNPDSLVDGIITLIESPDLADSIREKGEKTAEKYDRKNIYPRIDALLYGREFD